MRASSAGRDRFADAPPLEDHAGEATPGMSIVVSRQFANLENRSTSSVNASIHWRFTLCVYVRFFVGLPELLADY